MRHVWTQREYLIGLDLEVEINKYDPNANDDFY